MDNGGEPAEGRTATAVPPSAVDWWRGNEEVGLAGWCLQSGWVGLAESQTKAQAQTQLFLAAKSYRIRKASSRNER